MALLLATISLAALVYLLGFVYVPRLISQLASLYHRGNISQRRIPPAHLTSPYSSLWLNHIRGNGKTGARATLSIHQTLGPVIRLSPNEVSVASLEGVNAIYTRGFLKTDFYNQFRNYGQENLVSIIGNNEHTARKRMLSHVYAKSYIHSSASIREFSTTLIYEHFRPVLQAVLMGNSREGNAKWAELDAYALNRALGADFTSTFLMGIECCTGFVQDASAAKEFHANWTIKSKELPGHEKATQLLERSILELMNRSEDGGIVRSQLASRLASSHPKSVNSTESYSHLQQEAEDLRTIASEIFDNLIAGIETARIALTYLQHELSSPHNVYLQESLRAELRTLDSPLMLATSNYTTVQVPTAKDLDRLPLLDAVLKETLRLHPPSPASLPRTVPAGGASIHGFQIPAGTIVGTSTHFLHFNPDIFVNPMEFQPLRWFIDDEEKRREMNRHFWAFGSGGRMCIGSHYATYTAIYTSMETCIVNDEGIEQEDAFLAGPIGDRLVLGIRAVR